MVGTLKIFAAVASPTTLSTIIVGWWLVGELEGLVIDQDQDRPLRGKEGVQAGLGGDGLGHGRHSALRFRCSRLGYRPFIAA
jgi:hypothetical protein